MDQRYFFFLHVVKQNQIDNKKKKNVMDKENDSKTTQVVIIT